MKRNEFSALVEEDSDGILHNLPNARYRKWGINSLGFRGKEIDLVKEKGCTRVVCLGGSETFGYFENEGKEWPFQLGEMLKNQFPKVEVINASVVGLHPKDRDDYVRRYVLPLKPDLMIFFRPRLWEYVIDGLRRKERKPSESQGRSGKETLSPQRSLSLIKGLKKLQGIFEKKIPLVQSWYLPMKIKRKEERYLRDKKPLDQMPENIILGYEKHLESFILFLKEHSILPVLSSFPSLVTSSNKKTMKDISLASRLLCIELSEDGLIDGSKKFNDAARRIAEEQGVPFIDVDSLIPKTREYFCENYHYTNKGAEMIARNICDLLIRTQLIK